MSMAETPHCKHCMHSISEAGRVVCQAGKEHGMVKVIPEEEMYRSCPDYESSKSELDKILGLWKS